MSNIFTRFFQKILFFSSSPKRGIKRAPKSLFLNFSAEDIIRAHVEKIRKPNYITCFRFVYPPLPVIYRLLAYPYCFGKPFLR